MGKNFRLNPFLVVGLALGLIPTAIAAGFVRVGWDGSHPALLFLVSVFILTVFLTAAGGSTLFVFFASSLVVEIGENSYIIQREGRYEVVPELAEADRGGGRPVMIRDVCRWASVGIVRCLIQKR